jgi:hypothetical protein
MPRMLAPLGGVERPCRVVRFARLIHRPGRDLGGPAVRAAYGGSPMPATLPRNVVRCWDGSQPPQPQGMPSI